MQIPFTSRSKFFSPIKKVLLGQLEALQNGKKVTITIAAVLEGYYGLVAVTLSEGDSTSFSTDWEGKDSTGFPALLKAAATALKAIGAQGRFVLTVGRGNLSIQRLTEVPKELTRNVFKKSGFPDHTFVQHPKQLEIEEAMLTPGRGVVIEGSSGIGKTSCAKFVIRNYDSEFRILSAKKPDEVEEIAKIVAGRNFGKIIVDDFHDLTPSIKSQLSHAMKTVADDDDEVNKLVIIGINKAGLPLIEFSKDVAPRLDIFKIDKVDDEKIAELVGQGEEKLNISFKAKRDIVSDSHGCFSIAQTICNKICLLNGIRETHQDYVPFLIQTNLYEVKEEILEPFERAYKNLARKFAIGPSFSPEGRAPYLHILFWLAKSEDWTINLQEISDENAHLRLSLKPLINGKLASFMNSIPEFREIIFYDDNTQVLSIENQRFMYYVKNIPWNQFSKEIGYSMEFDSQYDVALSFAGLDRRIALAIFEALEVRHVSVFYDYNEQTRISGEDVERYLAPIYRSEAKFVVPILGKNYPIRLWTKFETEQFKERFKDGAVIPIRTNESDELMIPGLRNVGGLFFDNTKKFDDQIDLIVKTLIGKVAQYRRDYQSSKLS